MCAFVLCVYVNVYVCKSRERESVHVLSGHLHARTHTRSTHSLLARAPQVQIQWPLGGQALSPHNDKSVNILSCHVSLIGWVRINPKYGAMRPPSNTGSQPMSALLEKHFGSDMQSGAVVQIFDSGPSDVCSNVRLCPGDVFTFMYQVFLHTHTLLPSSPRPVSV